MRGEDAVAQCRIAVCGDEVGEQAAAVGVLQAVVLLNPEAAVRVVAVTKAE